MKQVLKQVLKQKDLERLYPIVEFLDENKQITIQQVRELLNKSRTTAWRYMKILVKTGCETVIAFPYNRLLISCIRQPGIGMVIYPCNQVGNKTTTT